jgi:hypothetical protein
LCRGNALKKTCVFCGERPEVKTKEHVIPQWLISFTGDPKREGKFGVDWKRVAREWRSENAWYDKPDNYFRTFSFDQLCFPACAECNAEFGKLEDSAKRVVETMLNWGALTGSDFHVLLDWLDKVRIGLWLGWRYLEKDPYKVSPKFHIARRIGMHDRMIYIFRVGTDRRRLNFAGCDLPVFAVLPCCFSLSINSLHILNVSKDWLFARRIGFPYPKVMYEAAGGRGCAVTVEAGRGRVMLPLLQQECRLEGTEVYQPMYPEQLQMEDIKGLYDVEYVRQRSRDANKGIGMVFRREGRTLVSLAEKPDAGWVPSVRHSVELIDDAVVLQTLETQMWLHEKFLKLDPEMSAEERRKWNDMGAVCRRASRFYIGVVKRGFRSEVDRGKGRMR